MLIETDAGDYELGRTADGSTLELEYQSSLQLHRSIVADGDTIRFVFISLTYHYQSLDVDISFVWLRFIKRLECHAGSTNARVSGQDTHGDKKRQAHATDNKLFGL